VTIFAVAALVAGPPLDYLRYHHYPLLRPEVLVPTAVWLLCALGIGRMLNRASRTVRIVAFTPLLLLFVDWQFSVHATLPFKVVLVAIIAGVWLLDRHLEKILAVALAAFYVAGLPSGSAIQSSTLDLPNAPRDTSLPPVLYMVLDEHIGIEGWPAEIPEAREAQRSVRQFYLDEGFRLFGRAYSEFNNSRVAIAAALNWPIEDPHQVVTEVVSWRRYRLKANEVFRRLSAEGYRIRVYQSTHVEYCDTLAYAIRSCETRPANSISNISGLDLPLWSKTALVGLYFIERNSHIYRRLQDLYEWFRERHGAGRTAWPRWEVRENNAAFPGAMELLGRLQHDLRTDDSRGTLYFAHLLAPHYPYVVDAACRPQPLRIIRLDRAAHDIGLRDANTPAGRAERYRYYAAQVGCLYNHLETLFHMIDSMPGARQMVVIIHGDHGSRITLRDPVTRFVPVLQPADLRDTYSTLFAIRAPGIPPGYDERFAPINELVGRALASGFTRIDVPAAEPHLLRFEMGFNRPFVTFPISDTALAPRH
jgi:hypothetical protein